MMCPECGVYMGKVWATPFGKNTLHELPDVEYCFECMRLYSATPSILTPTEIQSFDKTAKEDFDPTIPDKKAHRVILPKKESEVKT